MNESGSRVGVAVGTKGGSIMGTTTMLRYTNPPIEMSRKISSQGFTFRRFLLMDSLLPLRYINRYYHYYSKGVNQGVQDRSYKISLFKPIWQVKQWFIM